MATLNIYLGADNTGDNFNVPFYIELLQNNVVILNAWSTEGNRSGSTPTFIKTKTDFDNTLPTKIRYWNLGKKTNWINIHFFNLSGGNISRDVNNLANDGIVQESNYTIDGGNFYGRLEIICNEVSSTLSGVYYAPSGTQTNGLYPSVSSVKKGDASVSSITDNVAANPNYIPPTAPQNTISTPTPILTIFDPTSFACDNFGSRPGNKTIEVWKNGIAQIPLVSTFQNNYQFINQSPDVFKIRYKFDGYEYSVFSNEVDLSNYPSDFPTVTSWENKLNSSGTANFVGKGVAGSIITVYFNSSTTALTTVTVNSSGDWTYAATATGNYSFTQKTGTKKESGTNNAVYSVNTPPAIPESAMPTVTNWDRTVMDSTTAGFTGNGVVNAIVSVFKDNNTTAIATTIVNINGVWNYHVTLAGTYFFSQKEDSKSQSQATTKFLVNPQVTPQLAQLDISGSGIGKLYVNDDRAILNMASEATLNISLNDVTGINNFDYQILENGNLKFLKSGNYQIWQSKTNYTDSQKLPIQVVAEQKPTNPKPILSAYNANINDSVTVTNYSSYDNIDVFKNGIRADPNNDCAIVGSTITFKVLGSFQVIGYRVNYNNSVLSDAVTVSDAQPPTTGMRKFRGDANFCDVPQTDVQIGSGNTIDSVTNWMDGSIINIKLEDGAIPPQFYMRQKSIPNKIFLISPTYRANTL